MLPQLQPTDVLSTRALGDSQDAVMVVQMAHGDERAASGLYDRHSGVMFGLALRMVGEQADAEEIVLDSFAQAWRSAARFDAHRGTVAAWLMTIVRTRAIDLLRLRARRTRLDAQISGGEGHPIAMGEGFPSPDQHALHSERSGAIRFALAALPSAQRRVLELAFFEGLTHEEVAARLSAPLGTIKTRIRIGMQKLRVRLALQL